MENRELSNAAIPSLWMANQAMLAGLSVNPSEVDWVNKKLQTMSPTDSMKGFYHLVEFVPVKRPKYQSQLAPSSTTQPLMSPPPQPTLPTALNLQDTTRLVYTEYHFDSWTQPFSFQPVAHVPRPEDAPGAITPHLRVSHG